MKKQLLMSLGLIALASGAYLKADFSSDYQELREKHIAARQNPDPTGMSDEEMKFIEEFDEFKEEYGKRAKNTRMYKAMESDYKSIINRDPQAPETSVQF